MSELSTVLISDSRYADITSSVTIGVKDGPASVIHQKYQTNSNSTSSTLFNINVPSENTLIDRNLHVEGTLSCYYETTVASDDSITFKIVPSAFPMNQALQSATITLNNAKTSVQTQDVLQVYLKQFDQKFLSKHCQMTPSYVDKYYGKVIDAATNDGSGSYMSGIESAEKDSDTVGRFNENFSVIVSVNDIVLNDDEGEYTVTNDSAVAVIVKVKCSVIVSEPLLGLPTAEMKEGESNYLGINNLELFLQWNDMRNCFYISGSSLWKSYAGDYENRLVLNESARLNLKYMSLHASQYSKLNSRNVLPYDEMVCYKRLFTGSDATTQMVTDVISMTQIPGYIYMVVRPQYNSMKAQFSNHLCFPITGLNITFNNVSGLLTSYSQNDLYMMSRRNGSQQTWSEFRGLVKSKNGGEYAGIGSIIVINPTADLGLSDYLSSGSLGQFSFQATVTYANILGHTFGEPTIVAPDQFQAIEIATIVTYGGLLINDKGVSSSMTGMLTKQAVLESKSGNNPTVNYEEIQEMAGGNYSKMGTTRMSSILEKIKNMGKGKGKEFMKMNPTVGDIQNKLSKYM